MVRKLRYQEVRSDKRQRQAPRFHHVLEPFEAALIAAAMAALLWLQWLGGAH